MTYNMDSETVASLTEWARAYAPAGTDVLDTVDLVITYMQTLDTDDAVYFMDKGWGRCLDLANEWASRD